MRYLQRTKKQKHEAVLGNTSFPVLWCLYDLQKIHLHPGGAGKGGFLDMSKAPVSMSRQIDTSTEHARMSDHQVDLPTADSGPRRAVLAP